MLKSNLMLSESKADVKLMLSESKADVKLMLMGFVPKAYAHAY